MGKYDKSSQTTNNEINKKVTNEEKQPWEIQRITTGVAIDGIWRVKYDQKGQVMLNPDGSMQREYTPVSDDDLAKAKALIQGAIGFDRDRGDDVEVQSIQFDRSAQFEKEDSVFRHAMAVRRTIYMVLIGIGAVLFLVIAYRLIAKEVERRRRLREEELARQHQAMREAALRTAEEHGVEVELSVEDRARMEMQENAVNMARRASRGRGAAHSDLARGGVGMAKQLRPAAPPRERPDAQATVGAQAQTKRESPKGAGAHKKNLTGRQKAAVFLVTLGSEIASEFFKHLREDEIEQLTFEIARLESIEPQERDLVLMEFHELMMAQEFISTGGIDYARELLEKSLGTQKAVDIINRLTSSLQVRPFDFIRRTDPAHLLNFIQQEHPQTIALILAYLEPQKASIILGSLPHEIQSDVAKRIATMDRTSPEVLREVERVLEKKLSTLSSEDYTAAGGVESMSRS